MFILLADNNSRYLNRIYVTHLYSRRLLESDKQLQYARHNLVTTRDAYHRIASKESLMIAFGMRLTLERYCNIVIMYIIDYALRYQIL